MKTQSTANLSTANLSTAELNAKFQSLLAQNRQMLDKKSRTANQLRLANEQVKANVAPDKKEVYNQYRSLFAGSEAEDKNAAQKQVLVELSEQIAAQYAMLRDPEMPLEAKTEALRMHTELLLKQITLRNQLYANR